MTRWRERQVEWVKDSKFLRNLYATTWKGHPITDKFYYQWQLVHYYKGSPIGFCAQPEEQDDIIAGVYLVLPTTILVDDLALPLSTSLYTMTHPSYYKKGIFKRLAEATYARCAELGIQGTVGVPNNNSLPGFTNALKFRVIGNFDLIARIASPFRRFPATVIHRIKSEEELQNYTLDLDRRKSSAGTILQERSASFLSWRFFRCPSVEYQVVLSLTEEDCVAGLMVLRNAMRRGVRLTVIVDYLVDHTLANSRKTAEDLLAYADKYAWRTLSPVIMTLVNPFSAEAEILRKRRYRRLPVFLLPHASNFILRLHNNLAEETKYRLSRFEKWYFSFADYDLF